MLQERSPKMIRNYTDFSGGWNADVIPDHLADNELEIADNADLTRRGGIRQRTGTALYNTESYGSEVEQIIEWPRNDGTVRLLAVLDENAPAVTDPVLAQIGTGAGHPKTDLQVLDRANIGYVMFQDNFYFIDGDEYRVYDGDTVEDVDVADEDQNGVTIADGDKTDLAEIRRSQFMLWHPRSSRFFVAGDSENPSALYFSEALYPNWFRPTSVLYPSTSDGPVTALALFGDAVLVFFQNAIWSYRGVNPATDATWSRLPVDQGTSSPRSICLVPNGLAFLGQSGIYVMSPALLDYNLTLAPGEELFRNITRNRVSSVIRGILRRDKACAFVDDRERYLLAYSDGPDRNNRILVFDWSVGGFTRYTQLHANDFLKRQDGVMYFATNGYIRRMYQGVSDVDAPIHFKAATKQYHLDAPVHEKKLFRVMIMNQQDADRSSVDVLVASGTNMMEFPGIPLLDPMASLSTRLFQWGYCIDPEAAYCIDPDPEDPEGDVRFGGNRWGDSWGYSIITTKELRCRLQGLRIQVEFANHTADESVNLLGLAFEFRMRKARGEKVLMNG